MTLRQDTINIGIGGAPNNLTELDWQTFSFVSGALYNISSGNMTNVPAGVNIPGPTYNTLLRVNAPEGSTFHVDLIYSTTTSTAFQYYQIRIAGSIGSRTFTVRSIFNSADVIPVANGGTGGSTQAAARTNLGLGSASTYNTGTSGATIPLLSATNTWGGTQYFDTVSIGHARTNSTVLEIGSLTTAVSSNIDFHSSGVNQDFDARLSVNGGVSGTTGKADVRLTCNNFSTTSMSLVTALPVTSGGTGAKDAAGARTNLGLGSSATINYGTSGATIPLLNGGNTWSNTQVFQAGTTYLGSATTGNTFLKIGNSTQSGLTLFDIRTSGLGNDYDTRLQFSGGVQGSNSKGTLNMGLDILASSASSVRFNTADLIAKSATLTTALPVSSGGTGGNTPALARKGLELDPTATSIDFSAATLQTAHTAATGVFATKPAANANVNGGGLKSNAVIAGVEVASASFQMLKTVNSLDATARISVFQKGTGGAGGVESTKNFDFSTNGNFYMSGTVYAGALTAPQITSTGSLRAEGSILASAGNNVGCDPWRSTSNNGVRLWNSNTDSDPGQYINTVSGGWYSGNWSLGGVRGSSTELSACQLNVSSGTGASAAYVFLPSGVANATQWNNLSDSRMKDNIKTVENPIEKMKKFHGVTFTYKNGVPSAGYLAQAVREVLPEVVLENTDGMLSMNVAGVGALHHEAILVLIARIEELEAKVAALSK